MISCDLKFYFYSPYHLQREKQQIWYLVPLFHTLFSWISPGIHWNDFSLLLELHHSLEQECFVYSVNCNFSLFFIFKISEKRKINPVNFRIFAQKFIRIYKQNRKEIVFSPLVFFFCLTEKKRSYFSPEQTFSYSDELIGQHNLSYPLFLPKFPQCTNLPSRM